MMTIIYMFCLKKSFLKRYHPKTYTIIKTYQNRRTKIYFLRKWQWWYRRFICFSGNNIKWGIATLINPRWSFKSDINILCSFWFETGFGNISNLIAKTLIISYYLNRLQNYIFLTGQKVIKICRKTSFFRIRSKIIF